ncbi:MAG: SRPBCC domain-containing protein [Gemmatimonadaceae bacterium]
MAERSGNKADISDKRELVIKRILDAPRDLVWKAFSERDRAKQWWGPKDFTVPVLEMDPRPGGAWQEDRDDLPEGPLHVREVKEGRE